MTKLVDTSKLKSTVWREELNKTELSNDICYDDVLDTLILSIDNPKERIITHYLDSCVAILYRYSDKEIIGIKIESFSKQFKSFLQENNTWELSKTGIHIDGIVDMVFGMKEEKSPKSIPLKNGVALEPEFAYC